MGIPFAWTSLGIQINFKTSSINAHARTAMSNPNGLLSQKVCRYVDHVRTLKDILRAAH